YLYKESRKNLQIINFFSAAAEPHKDCEVFGVLMHGSIAKYQIPSTKLQTNLKFQYSMTKTGLEF
ncbi:MAG: hypothetical protein WBF29_17000, partial [Syntrophobacteria bacterium]